tara:strand:- start:2249 stop:2491 length:243 start_codon:yes stop_codon:yes gene_type:complete
VDYKNLRTVKQIVENAYPIITEGKMRWWIFHADTNGLAKAIVRIGGRVYLDRDVFNQWLEDQRDEPIPPMDVKPEDFSFE